MTPSLSAPTDNIYKFIAIFGLAIILASVLSYTAIYTSSLDRKVGYKEKIIAIETKSEKTKEDIATLDLNNTLFKVTKDNERFAGGAIFTIFFVGIGLSIYGFSKWKTKIQAHDDAVATLQKEKLQSEIDKLKIEIKNLEKTAKEDNKNMKNG